jgi:GT2 family glycosyltransferase
VRTGIEVSTGNPKITVGVTTRNRAASLGRCLRSLRHIDDLLGEVIVVDDASDEPVGSTLADLGRELAVRLRLFEQPDAQGYIVGRNTIVSHAANEFVLLLDDDAYLLEGSGLRRAVELLLANPDLVAIGCAQARADGSPWPASMQPSPASYACYVPAYIGFAHLVRRQVFLELGGYLEPLHFYGEERDFCLRALDSGYHVVYMPDVLVAHVPDLAGRSYSRYVRYVIRNACLSSLHTEPLPMPLLSLPVHLARYFSMCRRAAAHDPGGFWWIAREVLSAGPDVWRDRRPIRWGSVRRWRRLRRLSPVFEAR